MDPLPAIQLTVEAFWIYGEAENVGNSDEETLVAVEIVSEPLNFGEAAEGLGRTDPPGSRNRDE
jgi:hypothetical protein